MEIPASPDDMAIVTAVISMAHNLNIKVLAEGVESDDQKTFLQANLCDELQGFFFSPPLDAEALRQMNKCAGRGEAGVAKSPSYGVTAFFQDLDIPDVCLRPLKNHQAL
jgi:predicted signal transduction protein with EAL and GGDEF domain